MEKIKIEDYDFCKSCKLVDMYNDLIEINNDHLRINGKLRKEKEYYIKKYLGAAADYEYEKSKNRKAFEYIDKNIFYECDGVIGHSKFYSYHIYGEFDKEDLKNLLYGEESSIKSDIVEKSEYDELQERIDKAINKIDIIKEIIYQQPTNNKTDDSWIIDKFNEIKNVLKGEENED